MAIATGTAAAIGLGISALGAGYGIYSDAAQRNKADAYNKDAMRQMQELARTRQHQAGQQEFNAAQTLYGMGSPMSFSAPQVGTPHMSAAGFSPEAAWVNWNPQWTQAGFSPEMLAMGFRPQQFQGAPGVQTVNPNVSLQRAQGGFTPELLSGTGALGTAGFNTGQDALMQMLRSDPRTKVDQTLEGIMANQGDPYNNSELFRSMGVLDQRAIDEQIGQLRGSFAGLGQRFGSSAQRQEGTIRREMTDDMMARNAQIQAAAYEAAQGRRMDAASALTGREQFGQQLRSNIAGQVQSGGLAGADVILGATTANNQARLAGQQFNAATVGQNNDATLAEQQLLLSAAAQNNQANLATGQLNLAGITANNQAGLSAEQLRGVFAGQNVDSQVAAQQLMLQSAAQNNQTGQNYAALGMQSTAQRNEANLNAARLVQEANVENIRAALQAGGLNQAAQLQAQELALRAQQGDQAAKLQLHQLLMEVENNRMAEATAIFNQAILLGQPVRTG